MVIKSDYHIYLFILLMGVFCIVILGIYVQAVIGSCRYLQPTKAVMRFL
jgi:hypothetical protein